MGYLDVGCVLTQNKMGMEKREFWEQSGGQDLLSLVGPWLPASAEGLGGIGQARDRDHTLG